MSSGNSPSSNAWRRPSRNAHARRLEQKPQGCHLGFQSGDLLPQVNGPAPMAAEGSPVADEGEAHASLVPPPPLAA